VHCWARYVFIGVVAVLGTGQMIAACGQKGDLYLPEEEQEEEAQPAPAPAAPGQGTEPDAEAADVPEVPDQGKK
jgi:predicted small lipoprotein YifL